MNFRHWLGLSRSGSPMRVAIGLLLLTASAGSQPAELRIGQYVDVVCEPDPFAASVSNKVEFGPGTYQIAGEVKGSSRFNISDSLASLQENALPAAQGLISPNANGASVFIRGVAETSCVSAQEIKSEVKGPAKVPVVFSLEPKGSTPGEYVGVRTLCGLEKTMRCKISIEESVCPGLTRRILENKEALKGLKARKGVSLPELERDLKSLKAGKDRLKRAYADARCSR